MTPKANGIGPIMRMPSHADAFQVLLLQAADDGRGSVLFGDSLDRVRTAVPPFMVGPDFPGIYLEFPLMGDPFLDVSILYGRLEPHTRIESAAAQGTERMLDWFAEASKHYSNIACGFELDTKHNDVPAATVHFQPRASKELVRPFMQTIGANGAQLYLDIDDRMPAGWSLDYFGLFRGRPTFPLRVCGYLSRDAILRCAGNPEGLAEVFRQAGFHAYDEAMLKQATKLMGFENAGIAFQFDVLPDGTLTDMFALEISFGLKPSGRIRESFAYGSASRIMACFRDWGVADERTELVPGASFTRSLPVEADDGSLVRYAFTLCPQWIKARWVAGQLVPSKLYYQAMAGPLSEQGR